VGDAFVQQVVEDAGLAPLLRCSYNIVDKGLLTAFTERWHRETSSFHLPVGEMTITLDDVSSILHLPIRGSLFSMSSLTKDLAVGMLVIMLGVSLHDAVVETDITRGTYVRLRRHRMD
jgi:hypothetical protein